MIKIIREYDKKALASQCKVHPEPGEYLSMVENAYVTLIEPFYEDNGFCFVIAYRLVNIETLECSHFTETYGMHKGNPRSEYFFKYLEKNLPSYEQYEDLIGMREQLKITWEVVGGYAYPIVTERTFLDAPEEYKYWHSNNQEVKEV